MYTEGVVSVRRVTNVYIDGVVSFRLVTNVYIDGVVSFRLVTNVYIDGVVSSSCSEDPLLRCLGLCSCSCSGLPAVTVAQPVVSFSHLGRFHLQKLSQYYGYFILVECL